MKFGITVVWQKTIYYFLFNDKLGNISRNLAESSQDILGK